MIPAPRTLSMLSGLVMVTAVAIGAGDSALVAVLAAAATVGIGVRLRPAATAAVLLAALAILLGEPPAVSAALAGPAATAYLVLRHTADHPAVAVRGSTVLAATAFTLAAVLAAAVPVRPTWLPLLAPVAVVALYLLASHPLRTRYSDTVSYSPSPPISTRS